MTSLSLPHSYLINTDIHTDSLCFVSVWFYYRSLYARTIYLPILYRDAKGNENSARYVALFFFGYHCIGKICLGCVKQNWQNVAQYTDIKSISESFFYMYTLIRLSKSNLFLPRDFWAKQKQYRPHTQLLIKSIPLNEMVCDILMKER